MAIGQSDDGHAEVQQIGDDRKQGDFLAAMLGGGRCEGAPTFPSTRRASTGRRLDPGNSHLGGEPANRVGQPTMMAS